MHENTPVKPCAHCGHDDWYIETEKKGDLFQSAVICRWCRTEVRYHGVWAIDESTADDLARNRWNRRAEQ